MRTLIKLMLILVAGGSASFAQGPQNSEFTLLVGRIGATSERVADSNITVRTGAGVAVQHAFVRQIYSSKAGYLYIETPFIWIVPGRSEVNGIEESSRLVTNYFAPGVRFKLPFESRVSFFGMLGGGFGTFHRYELSSSSTSGVDRHPTLRAVLDFGGCVDLRLNRRFSLRGEIRDFVSGSGLSGASGHHHLIGLAGIALHF